MKYDIEEFGIVVEVEDGGGSISSGLQEDVPPLGEIDYEEGQAIVIYNDQMDAIESMILAHACEGIDVASREYVNGIRTAVESCANNS